MAVCMTRNALNYSRFLPPVNFAPRGGTFISRSEHSFDRTSSVFRKLFHDLQIEIYARTFAAYNSVPVAEVVNLVFCLIFLNFGKPSALDVDVCFWSPRMKRFTKSGVLRISLASEKLSSEVIAAPI